MMDLTLPWPPSTNTYWRHPTRGALAGRHLISEKGRSYRQAVTDLVAESRLGPPLDQPVRVEIVAFRPDRRRRDLDNLLKSILDSLTHAGVWTDDSLVADLRIRWGDIVAGMVKVNVIPLEESA